MIGLCFLFYNQFTFRGVIVKQKQEIYALNEEIKKQKQKNHSLNEEKKKQNQKIDDLSAKIKKLKLVCIFFIDFR